MKGILPLFILFFFIQSNGQIHKMVVTTMRGGDTNNGAIFVADSNGVGFTKVYSFDGPSGAWPEGDLDYDQNGVVYGVTKFGGNGDSCVIYSYDLVNNDYTLIHDFYDTQDSGWWDHSGGILLPDGKLYGVGQYGGLYDGGAIYRCDPTTGFFESLFDFDSVSGKVSSAGLISMGNGKLYGTTSMGGAYDKGTLFSFDPVTYEYTVLRNFNDTTGRWTGYGKLTKGKDGKIYGATSSSMRSMLFSYDVTTNAFTVMHTFTSIVQGAGFANCMVHTANGKLYGTTEVGGAPLYKGYLFSYDIQTDSVTILKSFTDTIGQKVIGGLTLATNGKIYGSFSKGGTYGGGGVFSYDIAGNIFSKVYEFDSISGYEPVGAVAEVITEPVSIGLNKLESIGVRLSPNPVSSATLVSTTQPMSNLLVYDLGGKSVNVTYSMLNTKTAVISGFEFLPDGTYVVRLTCGNVEATRKLIVQH